MQESGLVSKTENYLKEISNDPIDLEDIDEFENFKILYYKLHDRLEYLQELKEAMDIKGFTTPFMPINKYGIKTVAEVSVDEMSENSRHNQIFRNKANSKKNILDRVKSAIDSHKIAIGNLEQYGYVKCNSCYKKYSIEEYKLNSEKCTCKSTSFSFKINNEATHRIEIIPYLPLSGNYMVLMNNFSKYDRDSLKMVLNILKQERRGIVKTISMVIKYFDENNRTARKPITLDSNYLNNYEEEVRKKYGRDARIEAMKFHRSKPAIIDDKHARTSLAIAYVRYSHEIISNIKDDILKRRLSDFKRIKKYEDIISEFENQTPDFIDEYDKYSLEEWRKSQIEERLKKLNYMDKFGNMNRSLKRDLRIKESLYKNIFQKIAVTLIIWDIFKYYQTSSYNSRKIQSGPFPYIRVELDRDQRRAFQMNNVKVIDILNQFSDIKIIPIENMDLLLYEKFKFEKQIKKSNIKFNQAALGGAMVNLNSDIELEKISNAFNVNESRIKKEIKHINQIKNPKSDKSKKFLNLIKK